MLCFLLTGRFIQFKLEFGLRPQEQIKIANNEPHFYRLILFLSALLVIGLEVR